jgi:hypothetical protein
LRSVSNNAVCSARNWLYWIVVDAVLAWLHAAPGLVFTAFHFLAIL